MTVPGQTIVVTGAGGLIGRRLLAKVEGLHRCVAVVRPGSPSRGNPQRGVIPVEMDLEGAWSPEEAGLPPSCDAVIYLAQSSGYRHLPEQAASMFQVNVVALARMLEYARKAGAKSFVHASTGSVYRTGPGLLTEESPIIQEGSGSNLYPWCKLTAEALVLSYRNHFSTCNLRFFFVYGPEANSGMLIPRILERVRCGNPVSLQPPDGVVITPTYVDDAAEACLRALSLAGSSKLNIAGAEAVTLRCLAETAGELMGRRPVFEPGKGEPAEFRVDITAMKRDLGLVPRGLRHGLAETLGVSL